jgi:hypothetical protein
MTVVVCREPQECQQRQLSVAECCCHAYPVMQPTTWSARERLASPDIAARSARVQARSSQAHQDEYKEMHLPVTKAHLEEFS